MTPEQLKELLEILQDGGVTFYQVPGVLTLQLAPAVPEVKYEVREPSEPPKTKYHDPRLFPHGPPKFPGSE